MLQNRRIHSAIESQFVSRRHAASGQTQLRNPRLRGIVGRQVGRNLTHLRHHPGIAGAQRLERHLAGGATSGLRLVRVAAIDSLQRKVERGVDCACGKPDAMAASNHSRDVPKGGGFVLRSFWQRCWMSRTSSGLNTGRYAVSCSASSSVR